GDDVLGQGGDDRNRALHPLADKGVDARHVLTGEGKQPVDRRRLVPDGRTGVTHLQSAPLSAGAKRPRFGRDNGQPMGQGQAAQPISAFPNMSLPASTDPAEPLTRDRLLDGRLMLAQPRAGYRAGMDAALLAAACDARDGERVLEAGCGAGAALLAAAVRRPGARFLGLERDPTTADLCAANAADNALSERVEARGFDIARGFAALGEARFDVVMANPPFFDDPAALRAPAAAKRGAWMAE